MRMLPHSFAEKMNLLYCSREGREGTSAVRKGLFGTTASENYASGGFGGLPVTKKSKLEVLRGWAPCILGEGV